MSIQIKNTNEALGIILRGLDVAQSKGAFTLSEAAILAQARSFFISDEDAKELDSKKTQDKDTKDNKDTKKDTKK